MFITEGCFCCVVAKSCLSLCDPTDYSPPDSSVSGISQASILEQVAVSFSRGSSSQPTDWTQVSCLAGRFLYHWASRKNQCYLSQKVTIVKHTECRAPRVNSCQTSLSSISSGPRPVLTLFQRRVKYYLAPFHGCGVSVWDTLETGGDDGYTTMSMHWMVNFIIYIFTC